jgi:hypothetical protein
MKRRKAPVNDMAKVMNDSPSLDLLLTKEIYYSFERKKKKKKKKEHHNVSDEK